MKINKNGSQRRKGFAHIFLYAASRKGYSTWIHDEASERAPWPDSRADSGRDNVAPTTTGSTSNIIYDIKFRIFVPLYYLNKAIKGAQRDRTEIALIDINEE